MKKIATFSLLLLSFSGIVFSYSFDERTAGAKYLADLGFIQKRATDAEYNATSYITRAELTAIALKFAGEKVPEPYTCKKYFSDVTQNDWVCAAVEKAADIGLINKGNKNFNPQNNILTPEAIALILKASGLEKKINTTTFSTYEHPEIAFVPNGGIIETWIRKRKISFHNNDTKIVLTNPVDWRFSTLKKALYVGILNENFLALEPGHFKENYEKYKSYYDNQEIYSFREDYFIFRGDAFIIFGEAYKKMQLVSGEATI